MKITEEEYNNYIEVNKFLDEVESKAKKDIDDIVKKSSKDLDAISDRCEKEKKYYETNNKDVCNDYEKVLKKYQFILGKRAKANLYEVIVCLITTILLIPTLKLTLSYDIGKVMAAIEILILIGSLFFILYCIYYIIKYIVLTMEFNTFKKGDKYEKINK